MTKPNIPESTAPEKPENTGEPTNPQKPEGPTTSGEGKPNFKDIKAIGAILSTKQENILEATLRQQEEIGVLKQKMAAMTNELLIFRAQTYIQSGETCIYQENLSSDELRKLCVLLTELSDKVFLVLTNGESDLKYALGSSKEDVRPISKKLNETFNGRGGGKPMLCQGSLNTSLNNVQEFMSI